MFTPSATGRCTATMFWFLCISIWKTSIFKPNARAQNKTQIRKNNNKIKCKNRAATTFHLALSSTCSVVPKSEKRSPVDTSEDMMVWPLASLTFPHCWLSSCLNMNELRLKLKIITLIDFFCSPISPVFVASLSGLKK